MKCLKSPSLQTAIFYIISCVSRGYKLFAGEYFLRGDIMKKPEKKQKNMPKCSCDDPESRLCSKFDSVGIAKFNTGKHNKLEHGVVDNCAEEHIM